MLVEVLADFFTLRSLFIGNLSVSFLELPVLGLILSGYLLILLPDELRLVTTVLMLERMLVEQLLVSLRARCRCIDCAQEWQQFLREDEIESICTLFKRHLGSFARATLQLSDPRS